MYVFTLHTCIHSRKHKCSNPNVGCSMFFCLSVCARKCMCSHVNINTACISPYVCFKTFAVIHLYIYVILVHITILLYMTNLCDLR